MKERYELSIDPIEIPEEDIDIFIVDGKFNTRNYKAVDWLCTKIENGQTSLTIFYFGTKPIYSFVVISFPVTIIIFK